MSYINTIVNDLITVPVLGGLTGVIGERLVYGPQELFFANMPLLSSLNGWSASWAYFIVFGGAIGLLKTTGDFMEPLFNNQYLSYLSKISRPVSVGVLSMGLLWIVDSFNFSMYPMLYAFLIGAIADVVGEWGANMFTSNINPLLQGMQSTNSQPSFNTNGSSASSAPYLPPNSSPPSFSSGGNQYSGPVNSNRSLGSLFGLTGFTPY